jgi:hypothetical protein
LWQNRWKENAKRARFLRNREDEGRWRLRNAGWS